MTTQTTAQANDEGNAQSNQPVNARIGRSGNKVHRMAPSGEMPICGSGGGKSIRIRRPATWFRKRITTEPVNCQKCLELIAEQERAEAERAACKALAAQGKSAGLVLS